MVPKLRRTLYIGLGGTGYKTLLHTKRAFIETYGEVPPMIKFLAFDSNERQYDEYTLPSTYGIVKFDPSECSNISVEHSKGKVSRYRSQLSWLHDNSIPAVVDLVNGCGMVRTNGRIAFAFNYGKSRANILNAINKICNLSIVHNNKYDLLSQDVEVNIVFSIAGGTGSGTFIDMAYLVQDIIKEQALSENSKVNGYMVLPDVYDAQLTFGKEKLYPNACGCLVDLDYMMHFNFDKELPINYISEQRVLTGNPFNSIIAVNNTNLNGDVINNCDILADMLSKAMVVTAGEISGGMIGVGNNLERDMIAGHYNIGNKRAIIGTLGMSEITFRASELTKLYGLKAAREIATALLNPGRNVDIEANAWIDTEQIRENKGQDQVIDFILSKNPSVGLQDIYDKANQMADINNYRGLNNVAVNPNEVTSKVEELEKKIKSSLHEKIRTLVNTHGPVYALEFIAQVKVQINSCLGEMRDELKDLQSGETAKESAIKTAIEEFKAANSKFFGRQKAVQEAVEILCIAVNNATINEREISRRNGAITFYTWLLQKLKDTETYLNNVKSSITGACQIFNNNIAEINNSLNAPRGMFEIDLTKPYIQHVDVNPNDIDLNQFILSLPQDTEISKFGNLKAEVVANFILEYSSKLSSDAEWERMSVEDALRNLPIDQMEETIRKAIALSSPLCPLNFRGYLNRPLNNYYYVGVEEQSTTGLNGEIINFNECIPAGEQHETYFSSIGSRDKIVIYHQYGVFPTFAMSGTPKYRQAHDSYMRKPTSYSCFIDEDLRITMEREGFSVVPQEKSDDSLELWVKGLIFGLISRDEDGVYQYKDESNKEMALFGYMTSLGTKYRDEAFKLFKRECLRLQPQFEQYMINRAKAEGQDAINSIILDAKNNYLEKYSLNTLTPVDLKNPLYKGIINQLTEEVDYVNKIL